MFESYTNPGSVARFGATWPAPCRKILCAALSASMLLTGESRTSAPDVISADLIIIGDQSSCRSFNSAAKPATCGADIDVPLYTLNDWPKLLGGAVAARMSLPGAMTSGFRMSPPPAASGPRDENP